MTTNYVWFDGEFVALATARAYFKDNARYQSPSIVEGLRCYATERGAAVFRLQDHVVHFVSRVEEMGFTLDAYRELSLASAVLRTIMVNNLYECHVRLQLFMELPDQSQPAGNSRPKILITTTAIDSDPLTLSVDGYEADFTQPTRFVVSDNIVFTEPAVDSCDMVARETVIEFIAKTGYKLVETPFSAELLHACDEAFLCSTQDEIKRIDTVAGIAIIGPETHRITNALQEQYRATARGETQRSLGWVNYVTMEPLF